MTIRAKWSGDGLSPGTLTTSSAGPGDLSFGVVNAGITIVSSGPRPPRIQLTQQASNSCFVAWGASKLVTTVAQGAVRFYANFTGWGSGTNPLAIITSVDSGGSTVWRVDLTETGKVRLRDGAGTLVESSWSIPLNTLVRIEVTFAVNDFQFQYSLGDSLNIEGQINDTTLAVSQLTAIRFGNNSTSFLIPTWNLDEIVLTDTPVFIGPASRFSVWNGTAEVPASTTIWNGTSEVPASLVV